MLHIYITTVQTNSSRELSTDACLAFRFQAECTDLHFYTVSILPGVAPVLAVESGRSRALANRTTGVANAQVPACHRRHDLQLPKASAASCALLDAVEAWVTVDALLGRINALALAEKTKLRGGSFLLRA